MKKTYISPGYLELVTMIRCAGTEIPLHFKGGIMGSNGLVPGRFETANEAIQAIIEKSDHFKEGRIRLLMAK